MSRAFIILMITDLLPHMSGIIRQLCRRQMEQKLMTKGIGRYDINCAIDSEYTADEEKHIAKSLEKKHYDPDNCDEKEFRRIYQFLMRRGFKSTRFFLQ